MTRRRASSSASQLGFAFETPVPARRQADLAGLDRFVAGLVATALKQDARPRAEIAGAVTALLDEDVTKFMLDAYASEARETHNVSAGRFLALIAVTERHDLLDAAVRRVGAALLVGEEIQTARIGHLQAQKRRIDAELRAAMAAVQPISRGA